MDINDLPLFILSETAYDVFIAAEKDGNVQVHRVLPYLLRDSDALDPADGTARASLGLVMVDECTGCQEDFPIAGLTPHRDIPLDHLLCPACNQDYENYGGPDDAII